MTLADKIINDENISVTFSILVKQYMIQLMLEIVFAKAQLITESQNYYFHTQLFIYKASTLKASQ